MSNFSCSSTYTTLCIYHEVMQPDEIARIIGLEPSYISIKNMKRIKKNGWFLSTKNEANSTVLSEHLTFLLNKIETIRGNLDLLLSFGVDIRIFCFWESTSGNGGPVLDSALLKRLSDCGIDLHFDIWFDEESSDS